MQSTEPNDIPLYGIVFDHAEFAKCSDFDKRAFLYYMKRLDAYGYLARHGKPQKEWAFLNLEEYSSYAGYIEACRKVQKGAALRQARKAERNGFFTKFFDERTFLTDIVAIDGSAPFRQGYPLPRYRLKTVEERGGYPQSITPETPPGQAFTWSRHFGIFRTEPGHRQGQIVTDERLLGYIVLRRCAEFAVYATIFGHAEFLPAGITYKMHFDLVSLILDRRDPRPGAQFDPSLRGLRYLFYAGYLRLQEGLLQWKKKMLFRPGFFEFDYLDGVDPQLAALVPEPPDLRNGPRGRAAE